jgi:putative ABC transport system substrate-binding protein
MMTPQLALPLLLALVLLPAPLTAAAQPAGKVHRIGGLVDGMSSSPMQRPLLEAFHQGLRDLGYAEGRNLVLEVRYAEGASERVGPLAAELVGLGPDVLVAVGTAPALALKRATTTIPIVFLSSDAVGSGLVASLARPGGNVTGLSNLAPELGAKRLELLKEIVPALSRVALLWNTASATTRLEAREAEVAANTLGVELQSVEVRGRGDFDGAFAAITRGRAQALFVIFDPVTIAALPRIVAFAREKQLPAVYGVREFAEAGGLVAYGVNYADLLRRTGIYIDKILKGAKPADLPVEQPTKFELIVNLKTARTLGLAIPQSVLIRADHVIQ